MHYLLYESKCVSIEKERLCYGKDDGYSPNDLVLHIVQNILMKFLLDLMSRAGEEILERRLVNLIALLNQ